MEDGRWQMADGRWNRIIRITTQGMSRISKYWCTALALILLLPSAAWACEHCFGAAVDNATTRGIAISMAALLGFTGLVATGVLSFFRKICLRAKALEAGDLAVSEYGQLVDSSDTSDSN